MTIDLQPHPEGGRFREVFRSATRVVSGGRDRAALTHIYFELRAGERSRWHRVASDEVWNLYRGGLRLLLWDSESGAIETVELTAATETFCHVVPAGCWQAAEPIASCGEAVLVGCSVGPGFEFDDFELIEPQSETARRLMAIDPASGRFV